VPEKREPGPKLQRLTPVIRALKWGPVLAKRNKEKETFLNEKDFFF
jgi:hypothetical protein